MDSLDPFIQWSLKDTFKEAVVVASSSKAGCFSSRPFFFFFRVDDKLSRSLEKQRWNPEHFQVCPSFPCRVYALKGKEKFLAILHRYMEIHGTVYYETQRPPEVPAFVKNHGLLPQHELQQLLRKAKVGKRYRRWYIWIFKLWGERCFESWLFHPPTTHLAVHWIWLPLWRSRPSRGHSQWLHLPTAQV